MKRANCLVAAILVVLGSTAEAHTKLAASMPAAGAILAAPPEVIELQFSAPVRLTAVTLVMGSVNAELAASPKEAASSFKVEILQTLAPGNYAVEWRALSADTHVVSGDFRFTIAGP